LTRRTPGDHSIWHFMDALSIWGKEFASALASLTPTIGWIPQLSWTGALENRQEDCSIEDPPLRMTRFPIQRGYRRWPVGWISRTAPILHQRLLAASAGQTSSVLILTSPYYASLAEMWAGPVVYYVTDLLTKYGGFREAQVRALDKRICRAAWLVCPNSRRIAAYLNEEARCAAAKLVILPNATRERNVLPRVPCEPGPLPEDLADLARPVAGVIGNLAANMDWSLLERVVHSTPFLSWAFVGPTTMSAASVSQNMARSRLIGMGGRVRFVGAKPYGTLRDYARAFDVAIIPYLRQEPTYSGSSTRFYEHLAACRPILATKAFEELSTKEPLLRLARDREEMITHLHQLRATGFRDGFEAMRWKTSLGETWESRASVLVKTLTERMIAAERLPARNANTVQC
jgi:hypothetical protein